MIVILDSQQNYLLFFSVHSCNKREAYIDSNYTFILPMSEKYLVGKRVIREASIAHKYIVMAAPVVTVYFYEWYMVAPGYMYARRAECLHHLFEYHLYRRIDFFPPISLVVEREAKENGTFFTRLVVQKLKLYRKRSIDRERQRVLCTTLTQCNRVLTTAKTAVREE